MNHFFNNSHTNRKGIYYFILSLGILFFCFTTKGQPNQFDHYVVEDGLSQSVILSIYQDSDGFIWLGTQSGLSKFNGYEFVNYYNDPTNPASLSNNWIFDITEDTLGYLYLATKGGLNKFDKNTGDFSIVNFSVPDNITNFNFIYGLTSRDNFLYISTPPTLTIFNTLTSEKEVYQNIYDYEGTVYDLGSQIHLGKDNKLWIASHNGLSSFDLLTKKFFNFHIDQVHDGFTANNNITAIFEEKDGNILVGTENGLFIIKNKTNELSRLTDIQRRLSSNFIRAIVRDNEDNLWIATEGGGLNKMTIDNNYHLQNILCYRSNQGFVSHDIVYTLYIDPSENLWVGTLAGLDKVNLKKSGIKIIANTGDPESYDIEDNVIASVFKDHSGRLWIGNWGKGLNILNKKRDKNDILHYKFEFGGINHIPENHVHLIFEDSRKRIYIGTRDGISVYREDNQSFIPLHEYYGNPAYNCFTGIRLYCMMEDRTGKIWIGSGNGITILDVNSSKIETLSAESNSGLKLRSNLVYSIMEDSDGDIWIATSEGLNIYNPKNDSMYRIIREPFSSNSLCSNFTISLHQDKLGYIWIGTGSGLNRYSKKDSIFNYYSRANGLPSEIIYNIIGDNKNHLWFTTGRGLVTIDPLKAVEGKFTVIDQLKGQEFNLKATYKSEDGELFFGGMNGLFSFYPDSITKNHFIPPVRITSIEKENNGILESLNTHQDKIKLSYRDYAFTIEFSALDFTFPLKNRYSYKMEGLSDNWINLGERRFVHFTNLPPGSYTFMIKGSNSDGIWNEKPTSLRIRISPPWWASYYAYSVYFIILISIIIFIINFRERALRQEKRRLEIEVNRRTSEIALQKQNAEESEQKLRSTINSLDDILFVMDEKGRLQEFYNPRQRKTHFIVPEQHMGKHYTEIGFPDDVISQLKNAFEIFGHKTGITEFDHHFMDNGNIYWYNTKISPKKNTEGKLTGLVIVSREITDRKESEELLTNQKVKLDELNTTKDKFFSILAHDLKNPFTHLYSLSELLVKNYDQLEEADKIEALKKIYQSSGFIYELLENLLTWSRTQRGKIEYNPGPFDLLKLIEVNVNIHKIPAENKGIRIVTGVEENLLAYGDREMISTVLRNLINNAVKFSSGGGQITIHAEKKKDHFIVIIKDQGIGISEEDQKKLFRLDDKYKSKGTAGETGTGLGLVLCKEFIEKHGGKIWCESKVNSGSVFYFTVAKGNRE